MEISFPSAKHYVLALRSPITAHTGTLVETVMATIPIPGGAMGLWGLLRVTTFWSFTNSANNKSPRIRLGGLAGVAFGAPVLTANIQTHLQHSIANIGAANAQEYFIASSTTSFGSSSGALAAAAAINTAVDQDLVITGQLASAAETLVLRRYLVELLVP